MSCDESMPPAAEPVPCTPRELLARLQQEHPELAQHLRLGNELPEPSPRSADAEAT